MARARQTIERFSFVKGLITEASELTFPENASIEEQNFVLNRNGSRARRLGMDYENLYAKIDTSSSAGVFDNNAVKGFKWDNVDNNAATSLGVIQVGNKLWFLDLGTDNPSANLKNGGLPLSLTNPTIGVTISGNAQLNFSAVQGLLVISSTELDNPYTITYNLDTDVVSISVMEILVRDQWGVNDGLEVDERPNVLSSEHRYNLKNQGWSPTMTTYSKPYRGDPITATYSYLSTYPSNADILGASRSTNEDYSDFYHPKQLDSTVVGNTPAPKGNFIINPFTRGASRSTESGITSTRQDYDTGRISTVAGFSSRMFYAGVRSQVVDGDDRSPNLTGTVFFSKIVSSDSDLPKCFQESDPASEYFSDLVPTDGGLFNIPEASNIIRLLPLGASLVVFAENGVWQVQGRDGVFRADDFSITQISTVGCSGPDSIISVEASALYWADGGIYQLSIDQASGSLVASNLTESTIQTLFNDIPQVAKVNVTSTYDSNARKISWLFNDDPSYDGITLRYKYNKELVLDIVLQSWYVLAVGELDVDSPFVAGYMPTPAFTTTIDTQAVVVNGEQVQVNGEDVVVSSSVRGVGLSSTKYVVIKPNTGLNYELTLGAYKNSDYLDWQQDDTIGVDAGAFIVTGYELGGDTQRAKQAPAITVHMKQTEKLVEAADGGFDAVNPSSCMITARWDFSNLNSSGKWSTPFQAYRLKRNFIPDDLSFNYGYSVVSTKTKIRGSGRSLSFRMETKAGHDCQLLGWAMVMDGGTSV